MKSFLPFLLMMVAVLTLSAAPDDDVIVLKNNTSKARPRATGKDGKTAASNVYKTKYYYHWSHKVGKPHPEDLILALLYKQDGALETVKFFCTSDEYDRGRKDYLPGFWMQKAYVGKDGKVADGIYNLNFFTGGDMIYDHPVDVRYKENEDAWKSGKYQIWRHTSKARPNVMTYTMSIDKNGSLTLTGNGRPSRKFTAMDEAEVRSLNRNTYDAQQLASNRKVNPVEDPRQKSKPNTQTINYPDSSFYKGEVVATSDGRYNPHGHGRKVWKSGMTYDGMWEYGNPHGHGVMTWPSGCYYDGIWVKGKRTGKGRQQWPNGDWLEGSFVDNVISGEGKGYWMDNDATYEGDFENGKRNGYGVMRWGEKSKWQGERYEGQWEDNYRSGKGAYYYSDGRVEKGVWQQNVLVEPEEAPRQETPNTDQSQVFVDVYAMPTFPGGDEALFEWMRQNVRYDKKWEKKGLSGRVIVSFVVDSLGNVTDAKVARGVHKKLDAEALRMVRSMPRWQPAKGDDGKPVSSRFNIPIYFAPSPRGSSPCK